MANCPIMGAGGVHKKYILKDGILDTSVLGDLTKTSGVVLNGTGIQVTCRNNTQSIEFQNSLDLSKYNIFFKFNVDYIQDIYHYMWLYCDANIVFYKEQSQNTIQSIQNGMIITPLFNTNTGKIKYVVNTNEQTRAITLTFTEIWVEDIE